MEDIIQLKITLKWSKPPIWRRVLVDNNISFHDLHYVIQGAMGWENAHLYGFDINNINIEYPMNDDDFLFSRKITVLSTEAILKDYLKKPKQKFQYEYDFGDGWIHNIVVEKFLPKEKGKFYPVCIAGKKNCPPEDCGGIGGFYYMLEALNDKNHPEHEDWSSWIGDYDPDFFDIDLINEDLKEMFGK